MKLILSQEEVMEMAYLSCKTPLEGDIEMTHPSRSKQKTISRGSIRNTE
jgi:hypothetical protein